ncbi:MAG: acetyl-CoA carboxylase biotin carboxyl carrier protein [Candidatus Krumholzibacteria bacterium]|nr:acetyl-CoA carboxylase biotin carboxyl carrier protein [Candidatus Krumholzibacteria bacterium]
MRKEEIAELIRLVEDSAIAELEVHHGRRKIRISKVGSAAASAATGASATPMVVAASPALPEAGPGEEKLASNLKQIVSPMVGTFYRAPAPGSEPFVDVGQAVAVGQTVCIVEAMKLMNEIGSDYNGVVRRVLVDNAQPVEYGQPLFLVEMK